MVKERPNLSTNLPNELSLKSRLKFAGCQKEEKEEYKDLITLIFLFFTHDASPLGIG